MRALAGDGVRDWLRQIAGDDPETALSRLRYYQRTASLDRIRGGVAEELRGLLSDVLVSAYSLQAAERAETSGRPPLERILRAAGRAQGMVSAVLCHSPDARLQSRRVAHFDRLIGDLLFKFGHFLDDQTFVELHADTEGWRLLSPASENGDLIEQVLLNLLVNSVEAMPEGGQVYITTKVVGVDHPHVASNPGVEERPFLRLEVKDSGCGISRELLHRIFQPFYSTKPASRGAGLGLSLSYGIVEQLGGHMTVKSLEGWGTAMRVYLPAGRIEMAGRATDGALSGGSERHR